MKDNELRFSEDKEWGKCYLIQDGDIYTETKDIYIGLGTREYEITALRNESGDFALNYPDLGIEMSTDNSVYAVEHLVGDFINELATELWRNYRADHDNGRAYLNVEDYETELSDKLFDFVQNNIRG